MPIAPMRAKNAFDGGEKSLIAQAGLEFADRRVLLSVDGVTDALTLLISGLSLGGRAKLPFKSKVPSDHFLRNFINATQKSTCVDEQA